MKIIITEQQYYNLLEIKSNKTIRITESQYRRLINEQFYPVKMSDENKELLNNDDTLYALLSSIAFIFRKNRLKGGIDKIDSENKKIDFYVNSGTLEQSIFDEIKEPNYNFVIKSIKTSFSDDVNKLNVEYDSREDEGEVINIPPKTFNVDDFITLIRNKEDLQKNKVSDPKNLDTLVKTEIKKENPKFYEKVKKDDKFIRYCFPHMHWGTDIGGDSDENNVIYFKAPFKVEKVGTECFIINSLDGKYHKFCHSNNIYVYEEEHYKPKTKEYEVIEDSDEDGYDETSDRYKIKLSDAKEKKNDAKVGDIFEQKVIYENIGNVGRVGDVTAAHIHYEIGTGVKGDKLTGQYNPSGEWEKYWGVTNTYIDWSITQKEFITNKYEIVDSKNYGWRRFSKDGKLCTKYKEKYK